MNTVALLGPQRPDPTVGAVVRDLAPAGEQVAVISAAWQEAEGDLDELHTIIDRPLIDLNVYARCDDLLGRSPQLAELHRERQATLQTLQRLYRQRLGHLLNAALGAFAVDDSVAALDQRHAIAQVRALDKHHLQRVYAAHRELASARAALDLSVREDLRSSLRAELAAVGTVVITGGNVGTLLSRLRLLGVAELLEGKNIVAWSAGAMVLCEHVVLYHDRAPQGRRDAELFDLGFALTPGLVVLPNARRRLDMTDAARLGLQSRRFSPRRTVTLDTDTVLMFSGRRLASATKARRVTRAGELKPLRVRKR